MDHIEALERERGETRYSATAAAKALGFPASHFRGHPWRVPEFGLKGRRHPLRAWREWNERPEIELRRAWEKIPIKDRSAAVGSV
jgi:hypothetical protein